MSMPHRSLRGMYRSRSVCHFSQYVIRDARDTALRNFYGEESSGEDDSDSEDGEDAEGDGDASQEGASRADRRARFARLSAAIEAVAPRLRDCEYKELYDAAQAIHDAR